MKARTLSKQKVTGLNISLYSYYFVATQKDRARFNEDLMKSKTKRREYSIFSTVIGKAAGGKL